MKKFSELSSIEINALSDEEFKNISPFEKRSCYDCAHLESALSLWCVNKKAIKARGTTIPGCIKCPYWEPDWSWIKDKYKTKENGYVHPLEQTKQEVVNFYKNIRKFISKYFWY